MTHRTPEGGGIGQESLTDQFSSREHQDGNDGRLVPTVIDNTDIDYAAAYGFPGTGFEAPPSDPYTGEEMRRDLAEYAAPGFPATRVRDTAGSGRESSVELVATMQPYLAAGEDWQRRGITLIAHPDNTGDIYVGTSASMSRSVGPSQSVLSPGQTRIIRHRDPVYLLGADSDICSISIERYEVK
jgi:hypothetical protein